MTTRREVLKLAGLGVGAATASALGVTVNAKVEAHEAQSPSKPAQTEVTDKSGKRLAAGAEIAWTKVARSAAAADVTVDPTKTAQTILGFGAAFTDASCFTLSRLSDSDRANLLHTMFAQDQWSLTPRLAVNLGGRAGAKRCGADPGPSQARTMCCRGGFETRPYEVP